MFTSFLNLSSEKFARVSESRAREGSLEAARAPWGLSGAGADSPSPPDVIDSPQHPWGLQP